MHFFKPFPGVTGCFMGRNPSPLHGEGFALKDLFTLKQIHGDSVIALREDEDRAKNHGAEADGVLNFIPNRPIAVKTADCVPILFAHPSGFTGAVHAGWRGSAMGVLFKTLQTLENDFKTKVDELKLAIGPAICWDHYEVGEEVAREFPEDRYQGVLKPNGEKFALNLVQVNRLQALKAGVPEINLEIFSHCTFEDPTWHSYRRALKEGREEAGRNYSWIVWKG